MVFTLSKVDWNAHYESFLAEQKAEPKLSAAEYARRHGLNGNSARRSFNKIKAARLEGADRSTSESDRSPAKSDRSPKKQGRSGGDRTSNKKTKNTEKSKGRGAKRAVNAHTNTDSHAYDDEKLKATDHFKPIKRSQMPVERSRGGNFAGVQHGRYMDYANIDDHLKEMAADLADDGGAYHIMAARYLQMTKNQQELLVNIEEDYSNKKPWTDENGEPMPKSRAISQVIYGTSKLFTEVEKGLIDARLKMRKLQLDEQKHNNELANSHPLTRQEQITRTKELLAEREAKELSAVDAAYLFELEGLPVPRTLSAEADKEISLREPVKAEGEEITAEELDEAMADYEAQNEKWETSWLEEREQGLKALESIDGGGVEIIE